jgi:hypothetical protein
LTLTSEFDLVRIPPPSGWKLNLSLSYSGAVIDSSLKVLKDGFSFGNLKFVFIKADMAIGWQEHRQRQVSDQPNSEETPMSTAAVSSSSLNQYQGYFSTRQSDLAQLGQSLASGDLAGAQTQYNNIVQLGQNGPFAGGNPFYAPQREQDFTALGSALQSGDLAGAEKAFSSLKATFEKASGAPDPAPSTPSSTVGPEIVLNLNSSSGSSSGPEQIAININPTSGGGEQVSLSVGSQGSTNPQQFTFNLAANSNEQIVLNLVGDSSSTGSSSTGSASNGLSVSA